MTLSTSTDVFFDSPKGKSYELRIGPGPYIGKLERLERAPDGQFGPRLYWFWTLYNTVEGQKQLVPAQLNEDGSFWEWREMTSTKFGKNPKSGVVAAARKRAEALLRREIDDDEDPAALAREIIGKPAFLYLTTQLGNDGNLYLNCSAIEPYKPGMQAPIQRVEEEELDSVAAVDDELPFG